MKGIVFTTFTDMVLEKFGLETWEALLKKAHPKSGGAYTAGATYPFEELRDLVVALSEMQNIPIPQLLQAYGNYMFMVLAEKYPVFLQHKTFPEFLQSIHSVIHVEVKKLYPDADLPSIQYESLGENKLALLYRSPRKLCYLAMGLIEGAATYYDVKINITQPICMHGGADHCRLEVEISEYSHDGEGGNKHAKREGVL